MRQTFAGLVCFVAIGVAADARAQVSPAAAGRGGLTAGGWNVSFEFLTISTRGNDVHVGDEFTEHQRVSGPVSNQRLDYGVDYEPIFTRMKRDQSALVSAGYRGARWGFGARGYRVATDGAAEGDVSTAPETATSDSITGVRMWDNSIVPVTDLAQPSELSPVAYTAANELEHFRIEGYVERLWIRSPELTIGTRFGIARAHIENRRTEGQTMHAFDEEITGSTIATILNDITLHGESEATANLTGPVIAIAGDSTVGRFRLEWLVSHTALLGTAETTGEWTDVDDITDIVVTPTTRTETATVLSGVLPIEREERVMVPVLDLQIRGAFQVARNVSVGLGVFSSTWFKMPVAPAFSIPDDWTSLQGAGWRQQTRDVSFTGLSLFVGFGF
jgi:hypothetical protein